MKTRVTEADLLAAVMAATAPPPDDPGVSVGEYAAARQPPLPRSQAEAELECAVRAGRLVRGHAHRQFSQQRRRVRVYRPA